MKTTSGRSKKPGLGSGRAPAKVRRTYRLTPEKLAAAQKILGTSTATEAIETALDMVVFRQELLDGTREMFGIQIDSPDHRGH